MVNKRYRASLIEHYEVGRHHINTHRNIPLQFVIQPLKDKDKR